MDDEVYTFDDFSFGISDNGNLTVTQKIAERPWGITNAHWYKFCSELADYLNQAKKKDA